MILLDTNILSEWMRPAPDPVVITWLDRQPEKDLFLPAIAKAEIETGIARLPEGRRKTSLALSAQVILDSFADRCLALDCAATIHYAQALALSKTFGRPMAVEDAQIAAIAVANGLTLATRNTSDFDFLDTLSLLNPWLDEPE